MQPRDLTWRGGRHPFRLGIGELRALQHATDAGPAHVLARLQSGEWLVDDVTETIRLGLTGGGMDRAEATRLVDVHVEDRLGSHVMLATAIIAAALYGVEDDPVGEVSPSGEAEAPAEAMPSLGANGASRG